MTERNIASTNRKKIYYCISCQRVKDKKKRRHFVMASFCNNITLAGLGITLQWLRTS